MSGGFGGGAFGRRLFFARTGGPYVPLYHRLSRIPRSTRHSPLASLRRFARPGRARAPFLSLAPLIAALASSHFTKRINQVVDRLAGFLHPTTVASEGIDHRLANLAPSPRYAVRIRAPGRRQGCP